MRSNNSQLGYDKSLLLYESHHIMLWLEEDATACVALSEW